MKKLFYFLLLFVMLFPVSVFAEEVIGDGSFTESKIYFYDYPNGYRTVSTTRDSSLVEEEILLYSGRTDENGKVVLSGFEQSGEVRIVEKIPNGYSTTNQEYYINLEREDSVQFVNTQKLIVNPKTTRSVIALLTLFVIFGSFLYLILHRQDDLLVLSIAFILFFFTSAVSASSKNFVVTVKDGKGKGMSNVEIEVYGKPNNVFSSYYFVFDSNGGFFPSGSDKYYVPIPLLSFDAYELLNILSYDDYTKMFMNIMLAQKDGYLLSPSIFSSDDIYNGQIIDLEWSSNSDYVMEIDLNGGSFTFINNVYDSIKVIDEAVFNLFPFVETIINQDLHFIGFDNNASCSHFNQYGLSEYYYDNGFMMLPPFLVGFDFDSYNNRVYACWHEQPDGMYFNDSIFLGNIDSCYVQSKVGDFQFASNDSMLLHMDASYNFDSNQFFYQFSPLIPLIAYNSMDESLLEFFDTMKIIDHGQVVISFDSSDFSYDSQEYVYNVTNQSKLRQLNDYFNSMNCR